MESLSSAKLSSDEINWIIGALDPFHDENYIPTGFPDGKPGKSVTQFIKKKVVLSRPDGIGDNDKWDCHIFTAPLLTPMDASFGLYSPGRLVQSGYSSSIGSLNVVRILSGQDTLPAVPGFTPGAGYSSQSFGPSSNGNAFSLERIVGGGFEVHNDTAELYKEGSVTVYSQPCDMATDFLRASSEVAAFVPGDTVVTKSRIPPGNVDFATSNVDARTWSAKDGVYVPFRLDLNRMGYSQATALPHICPLVDSSLDYTTNTTWWGTQVMSHPLTAAGAVAALPTRICGLETTGAYFTGLSPQTVLTLDYRFIVEVSPTPSNSVLISLAHLPPKRQTSAFQIYEDVLRKLEPGCAVGNNASGDWWRFISKAIKTVSPMLGMLGPEGMAFATAAETAAAIGDRVLDRKIAKRVAEIDKKNGTAPSKNNTPAPRLSSYTKAALPPSLVPALRPTGKSHNGAWKELAQQQTKTNRKN